MQSANLSRSDQYESALMVREFAALIESVSKTVEFTANVTENVITCSVQLPENRQLSIDANSADRAARQLLRMLADEILTARLDNHWGAGYECVLRQSSSSNLEGKMQTDECGHSPSRTKERQETIGVSTKRPVHDAISAIAQGREESIAAVTRDMVAAGFEDFETRTFSESKHSLLANFESFSSAYSDGENMQWMVRLNRRLATRIKLTAREYGKSASQMVAMCISNALVRHSEIAQGKAIPTAVDSAKALISGYTGVAVRRLAEDIGLGKRGPLLSGVLSGKTAAPRTVLRMLSLKFKLPMPVLNQAFKESLASSPVPAFKAGDIKPQVMVEQQSWEDAVKSLRLSAEDTAALLKFSD